VEWLLSTDRVPCGEWLIKSGRFDGMKIPKPGLTLARDQILPDTDRRQLAREANAGAKVRLARGAYLPADIWNSLGAADRSIATIAAATSTLRTKPVYSHASAAVLWDLPVISGWPAEVHITVDPGTATRSRNRIVRHSAALHSDDVVDCGSYFVTSVARTILDAAATFRFIDAVTLADRALLIDRYSRTTPMVTREQLEDAWDRSRPMRAHSRTRAVLSFAETRAGSPLESVSRVTMRIIGVPRPRLQVPYYDAMGFIGEPDFSWGQFGVVGEADGDAKYTDPQLRSGRTAEQVVIDEKVREDRLRALGLRVPRWRWNIAIDPSALRARLTSAGLPTGCKW
jgi:hypothetical protein